MAKQTVSLGTAPTGAGGDTFRSAASKLQANDNELYAALGGASGTLPSALPIANGGTGQTTALTACRALRVWKGERAVDIDLNTIIEPGFYGNDTFASGLVSNNFPVSGQTGSLQVLDISGSNGYRIQIYKTATTNETYSRITTNSGTSWSAWKRAIDANDAVYQQLVSNGLGAGGFSLGAVDLNTLAAQGFFVGLQNQSTAATAAKNYPTTASQFILGFNIKNATEHEAQLSLCTSTSQMFFRRKSYGAAYSAWFELKTTANTTVDGSGFIKAASPVVKLFNDHIELNDDAQKQPITFEKLGIGDYLVKGSLGLAQEGWYIEVPKDANGNTVVAVIYTTLENGDISVKTHKRKFDFELAAVVPDLDNPIDIPDTRWIDLRLHEEPQLEEAIDDTEQ
ncbi:pyocin knob domain-containing protein [Acinetobacter tibetensis]|uniref:Pyocin knob domain-containing protein n=1 Tax=Acinetobacter tibetensis TaxID=2943497 RepID=A0AAE9S101_9GAMM|nr:pyocin knob domain-containing protein [Acinetobacter tibetensis]USE84351.1 pyocin knob domain-containing protein [Acinetobacter tibetensis]